MQVKDKHFKPFIGRDVIQQRIAELGRQIDADYAGQVPLLLGILNGAFIFASDLLRAISIPCEMSFIKLASYKGTRSTGNIVSSIGLEENLSGRHVVVVEDIIDTGNTLNAFLPEILQRQPASLKIASFLFKPDALQHDIKPDYMGFSIPNNFVVGYGLDYDGYGRNFPDLYTLDDQ